MLGKIIEITEVFDLELGGCAAPTGTNGSSLGIAQMLNGLRGYGGYDGYKIETDEHVFYILIDNSQNCCESWGYFSTEEDLKSFVGRDVADFRLSESKGNGEDYDAGGVQFVDFVMADGMVLQFAVYNSHNGYYGHSIIVAKDDEVIYSDTL